MKTNTYLLTALSVLVLSACGGGDTPAAPPPVQPIDKYVGSWKTVCYENTNGVQLASNGLPVYQTRTFTYAATGATSASWVWIDTYFAPTDTTCAQASIGNVTRPNTNKITIDGTTTIGANLVDKITYTAALPFPGAVPVSVNGPYIINGLDFANSFNESVVEKVVGFVNGSKLTFGGGNPLDAGGYPTTLSAEPGTTFTKQ